MATPRKPGARKGRPPGAKNRRTVERAEAVEAAASTIETLLAGANLEPFEGDAHALLMMVYKNPAHEIETRIDAAKAAIRYEKPSLASIDHTGANVRSHEAMLDELEAEPEGGEEAPRDDDAD
jgi:hypothetical protein